MSTTSKPTSAKDRVVFLDVLRGFALTGILFANILSWSGIKFLPFESIIELGNVQVDSILYKILTFLVDTKFYTIFSILFGVGFYMQLSRNLDNPSFAGFYFKRQLLLLLIGSIHTFFWSGDILMLYALMGMILIGLRRIPVQKFLAVGAGLYFFPIVLDIIYMHTFAQDLPVIEKAALKTYSDMSPEAVVAGFQSGEFFKTFSTNWHNVFWRWYDFIPSGRPFKVLGLFFFGSYLYHKEFFTKGALKTKNLLTFLIIGIVFTTITINMKGSVASFSRDWNNVLYRVLHEFGQIGLSLSYICILAKFVERFTNSKVVEWLKNYGRMSLTSYVGHTVMGILVFYPVIAFGYFGKLTLETIYYVAWIILVIQIAFSTIWFKYFKFGPVEWLWRCASYGKWFPILKDE